MKNKIPFSKNTGKFILAGLLTGSSAYGQSSFDNLLNDGVYIFDGLLKIRQSELFTTYKSNFGLNEHDSMAVYTNQVQKDGTFNAHYDLYYKGIPVEGSRMNVMGKNAIVLYANGFLLKDLDPDVDNIIPEQEALESAKEFVNAAMYQWEDPYLRDPLEVEGLNADSILAPGIELVIAKSRDTTSHSHENYQLCYKISIISTLPAQSITVYVNANDGSIFTSSSNSYDDYDVHNGRVVTAYNGIRTNMSTRTCTFCSNYRLENDTRNIVTKSEHPTTNFRIIDGDNDWDQNVHKTAASAHWALQTAWDYYWLRRGRQGSNYSKMRVYVTRNTPGMAIGANAQYEPTGQYDWIKVRPDGSQGSAATLDVLAHEYTHAMISRSSQLGSNISDYDAAAMAEGFSDIFGMIIEGWANNGVYDWAIGEDLDYIRHFQNPHDDMPNASSEKYLDPGIYQPVYGARHLNGGILRKWFHLLSEGGTLNGVTVQGLGIERASDIAYVTFNWSLWSNIRFSEIGAPTVWGTIAHWGRCSNEHKQVVKALQAVNIPVPLGWQTIFCGIQLDGPNVVDVRQGPLIAERFRARLGDEVSDTTGSYSWNIPDTWNVSTSGNELILNSISDTSSQKISVTYTKGSTSITDSMVVHFSNEHWVANVGDPQTMNLIHKDLQSKQQETVSLEVYPNPAANKITIAHNINTNNPVNLEIYDMYGKFKMSKSLEANINNIDISSLINGIYLLRCKDDMNRTYTRKLIINK